MSRRASDRFDRLLRLGFAVLGLLLVAAGAAWIYPPLGLIALGGGLLLDAALERKTQ